MHPPKSHVQEILEAELAGFRSEHKANKQPTRIAITNQQALLDVDPRRILAGEVEIYDPREQRPH